MAVSDRERVSHVVRRLAVGAHPDVVERAASTEDAAALALDLRAPPMAPLTMDPPASVEDARRLAGIVPVIGGWLERMRSSPRLVEERLVWFWHDHFATSIAKVRAPYLMWQQHMTLRRHATGSFAALLHAVAKDPAMLVWLDGVASTARNRNENFGRECLELFTLGRDAGYTQDDVVAASRCFTGWTVNAPGRRASRGDVAPYASFFVPRRHDDGVKTLLGRSGQFDLDGALDVVLAHPSTARFVATKLYRELVGLAPEPAVVDRLAAGFRRDYAVMPLVEAIVAEPAFVSDDAVRARVRTPVEKLVTLVQAAPGAPPVDTRPVLARTLRAIGFVPFAPPNVGGFPKGEALLGPHQLVHTLDLLGALAGPPDAGLTRDVDALFARFGVFDVTTSSRAAVARRDDPTARLALVLTSPEVALT